MKQLACSAVEAQLEQREQVVAVELLRDAAGGLPGQAGAVLHAQVFEGSGDQLRPR